MKKKNAIAMALAVTMLLPTNALALAPEDFSDFPNNWSSEALKSAIENGLLTGSGDKINPSGNLTRAEMAAIVNRAFGATEMASLAGYSDVSAQAWYYSDMAKAVQMGTFQGADGKLNPTGAITREEAFTVLARAFGLEDGSNSALNAFSDSDTVSDWARGSVAALVAGGYVSGANGKLNPKSSITRAEFAQVMYMLVGDYISQAQTVSQVNSGNVVIRTAGATLSNTTVSGDLILADGIGEGDVTLDGVTVKGRLLVRGGGPNSVHITNSNVEDGVVLENPNGDTRIVTSDSTVGTISVESGLILDGDADRIELMQAVDVTVQSGTVGEMTVADTAEKAVITVADGAEVTQINVQADGVQIGGKGKVESVQAEADDIAVTTPNTEVTAAEGTSGVTAGGKAVEAGQVGKINASGTGAKVTDADRDDNKGNSGGSSHRPGGSHNDDDEDEVEQNVHKVDSWQTLKQAIQNAEAGDIIRLTKDITDAGAQTTVVDGVSSATLPMEGETGKYFTLDGDGHTITAASESTFCFLINTGDSTGTTTVKDLIVDGGSNGNKVGGAFFLENGKIVFDNVTFKNCGATSSSATNGGGALCLNNHGGMPDVTVRGCTFIGNYVGAVGAEGQTGRGGAIYANYFNTKPITEETAVMKLTVEDSVFTGNQAAYGGAIAADGNVELTVKNCEFSGNESATGGDDIYIFDGVSAGKKGMSIYSHVEASLSGNTYTNSAASESDMTAMNIIYARYYPAGYIGTPGTAPEGAVDLTFSNIERTELAESVQSIAMKRIKIGGQDYYYGVAAYGQNGWITDFTVNGQVVEATRIDGTNVYYYTSEELTGSLYGTASLSYAEFYEGDIADTSAYDAVSSATTKKNGIFTNADSTEPVEGEGYQINGVKNVPVQVDATQYAKAEILEAASALSGQSEGYVNAAEITLNEAQTTAPAWYKTLNADGSYSAMVVSDAAKTTVADATASLNTSSNWGDYLIAVDDPNGYLRDGREGTWPVDEDIMGIVVEAEKDGQTVEVGLRHLENIWVQTYEFAFDAEGTTADLEGATIEKITYIVPEGVYEYTFDGIYVLPQYPEEVSLSAAFDETQKYVTITGLPGDLEDVKVNIYENKGHGQKTMLATNKLPDLEGKVSLDDGASVASDVTYTVQISSSNYADLSTTVKVDSETPEPEPGDQKTATGEASVGSYGYNAKVIVTYDPTTGKIVSVEDNGTEPGTHNQRFWDKAKAMFAELIGKTKNEVDTVDAVSSATYSSNAIKEAVLDALEDASEPEAITMTELSIAGKTYYYAISDAEAPAFQVNGQAVQATRIDGTNVYYYTSEELTGSLYGTASLSYAEFYEGDIADTSAYDAVSSATTKKNGIFTNADSTEPVEGEGYQINGVKNVPVQVDATQYAKAEILEAASALSGQSEGYVNAAEITLNEAQTTAPAWYKTLNADGSYSAMVVSDAAKTTVADATASLNTSSNWGDYLIAVDDPNGYLRDGREGTWPVDEDIMGIVVEAEKDGQTVEVGLRHLENIWVQTYEFAFDAEGTTADLEGATIEKITYIVPEGVYEYTFDGIYVLPQYPEEVSLSAAFDETQKYVTITGLPGDLEDVKVNIYENKGHGQKTMLATNKLPDLEGKVSLDDGASVASDVTYTVQISSSNYADLSTTVKVDSETPEPEPGDQKTATGEASVGSYGYNAKVIVTYDPTTGKIVSVEDNGTAAGSNAMFWNMLTGNTYSGKNFWEQFEGLTAEGVRALKINPTGMSQNTGEDNVDAVSGATYSSKAVQEAVLDALPD